MDKLQKKQLKKDSLKRLKSLSSNLDAFVTSLENRSKQFTTLSREICKRMQTLCLSLSHDSMKLKKRDVLHHFLLQWFRSFCAYKDECMVLFKGECHRAYHVMEHKSYLHVRGATESKYYKCKTLSACSVDGLNYEIRSHGDKYGMSDSVDNIGDRNDIYSSRIEKAISIIDATLDGMYEMLVNDKNGIQVQKAKIDMSSKGNKHNGEELLVIIDKSDNNSILAFTRERDGESSRVPRAETLSLVVEDPPHLDLSNTATTTTGQETALSQKKKSNASSKVVQDLSEQQEKAYLLAKSSLEASQAEERRKEKEAEWGMEVSLDEIKRAFGAAYELQSSCISIDVEEEHLLFEEDEKRPKKVRIDDTRLYASSGSAAWTGDSSNEKKDNVPSEADVDMNNYENEHESCQESTVVVTEEAKKRKKRGVSRTAVTRHICLPNATLSRIHVKVLVPRVLLATIGAQFVDLSVEVTYNGTLAGWNENKAGNVIFTPEVRCDDVLDEVYRRLWCRFGYKWSQKEAAGNENTMEYMQDPLPLLPRQLRVGSGIYTPGSSFTLPDKTASIFVECFDGQLSVHALTALIDDVPSRLSALRQIIRDNMTKRTEETNEDSRGGVPPSSAYSVEDVWILPDREVLLRVFDYIAAREKKDDVALDLSSLPCLVHEQRAVLVLLQSLQKNETATSSELVLPVVKLDHSPLDGPLLAFFLLHAQQVSANCCGITSDTLHHATSILQQYAMNAKNSEADQAHRSAHCTSLNLRYNPLLSSQYVVPISSLVYYFQGEGPLQQKYVHPLESFLTSLFLHATHLGELDLSHCLDRDHRNQYEAMTQALVVSLQQRQMAVQNGGPGGQEVYMPLYTLKVQGLQQLLCANQNHYGNDNDGDSGVFVGKLESIVGESLSINVGGMPRAL